MQEKKVFILNEDDLREVVSSVVYEVIAEIRKDDPNGDMEEIMTVSDIADLLGIDKRNLNSAQKYYLPFDRPCVKCSRGAKGWKRRDVLEHIARRDCDIKRSYEEFLAGKSRDRYAEKTAMYSAKAMAVKNTDGTNVPETL